MKLISIDGLIYWYKGEAKEWPKHEYCKDCQDIDAFLRDCVLCEDQRKAKILIWDTLPCDVPFEKHLPDRTLYFVDVEFEEVGQQIPCPDNKPGCCVYHSRTVARIKERKPKEESQEELWDELLPNLQVDEGGCVTAPDYVKFQFHLTRKPTAETKAPTP